MLSEQSKVFFQAGIKDGRYLWTEDLLHWRGSGEEVYVHPPNLLSTKLEEWRWALQDHPDRDFIGYILSGIAAGFEIGVERKVQLVRARHNLPSAEAHTEVVEAYLEKEVAAGRIKRVQDEPNIHLSPLGLSQKRRRKNGDWLWICLTRRITV